MVGQKSLQYNMCIKARYNALVCKSSLKGKIQCKYKKKSLSRSLNVLLPQVVLQWLDKHPYNKACVKRQDTMHEFANPVLVVQLLIYNFSKHV